MITSQHIDQAIEKALSGESNLTDSVYNIRGFSNGNIRRLINNLTNMPCTYLEVGVLMGGTFVSSFNKDCVSIGFENFTEYFQNDIGEYKKEDLEVTLEQYKDRAKDVQMHYECAMDCDKNKLPNGIDIYMYDGEHGLQNHSIALPEMFDKMANRFAFIVDDMQWQQVKDGTGVGFKFLRNKIHIEKVWELKNKDEDDTTWVCGVNIYLISKK